MKKIVNLVAVAALGALVAGCNFATFQAMFTQDVQKIEAKIAAIVATIKKDAPIVLADVQTGINLACSIVPSVSTGIADLNSAINSPGPKATALISQAAQYAQRSQNACNAYNAAQTSSAQSLGSATTTLIGLWNSYKAGKAALQQAQTAVASVQ